MNTPALTTASNTVSHVTLAVLAGKDTSSVKRLIEALAQKGVIMYTQLGNELHVNERDSYVAIAQLCPEYTGKLVDFWLENRNNKPKLPETYEEALEHLLVAVKEKNALEAETKRLNSVCNEIANQFTDGVTIPDFCKGLNGVNVMKVNAWLVSKGLLNKTNTGYCPTSYARDSYFKYENITFINKKYDRRDPSTKVTVTVKGAKWLYSKYLKGELPMKASWNGEYSHNVIAA